MWYPIVVSFCPSFIAAASVYAAMRTLDRMPAYSETLKLYTGESEYQLYANMLVRFQSVAKRINLEKFIGSFQILKEALLLFCHLLNIWVDCSAKNKVWLADCCEYHGDLCVGYV